MRVSEKEISMLSRSLLVSDQFMMWDDANCNRFDREQGGLCDVFGIDVYDGRCIRGVRVVCSESIMSRFVRWTTP